jgi:hypothetical protein
MDTLAIGALVLILTNIIFAILAERQRHRATAAQSEIIRLVAQGQKIWANGYNTGLLEGVDRGMRESGQSWQKGYQDGWDAAVAELETCREIGETAKAA